MLLVTMSPQHPFIHSHSFHPSRMEMTDDDDDDDGLDDDNDDDEDHDDVHHCSQGRRRMSGN